MWYKLIIMLVWTCMNVYGRIWTCMDVYGRGWTWMDVDGRGWTWMDVYGRVWTCMDVYRRVRTCMDVYGRVWTCIDVDGRVWTCMDVYGRVWTCMEVNLIGVVHMMKPYISSNVFSTLTSQIHFKLIIFDLKLKFILYYIVNLTDVFILLFLSLFSSVYNL